MSLPGSVIKAFNVEQIRSVRANPDVKNSGALGISCASANMDVEQKTSNDNNKWNLNLMVSLIQLIVITGISSSDLIIMYKWNINRYYSVRVPMNITVLDVISLIMNMKE